MSPFTESIIGVEPMGEIDPREFEQRVSLAMNRICNAYMIRKQYDEAIKVVKNDRKEIST